MILESPRLDSALVQMGFIFAGSFFIYGPYASHSKSNSYHCRHPRADTAKGFGQRVTLASRLGSF